MLLWRPDGITEAHCLRAHRQDRHAPVLPADGNHGVVPDEHCVCGLYAWRDPATLAAARRPRWTSLPCVVGVARLGGRMIVGERGFRAQRGYPVAVLDRDGVVSGDYPIARYRTFAALVAEWADRRATDPRFPDSRKR